MMTERKAQELRKAYLEDISRGEHSVFPKEAYEVILRDPGMSHENHLSRALELAETYRKDGCISTSANSVIALADEVCRLRKVIAGIYEKSLDQFE